MTLRKEEKNDKNQTKILSMIKDTDELAIAKLYYGGKIIVTKDDLEKEGFNIGAFGPLTGSGWKGYHFGLVKWRSEKKYRVLKKR